MNLFDCIPRDVPTGILHAGRIDSNEASNAKEECEVKIRDRQHVVPQDGVSVRDGDIDDLLGPKGCSGCHIFNGSLFGFLFIRELREFR